MAKEDKLRSFAKPLISFCEKRNISPEFLTIFRILFGILVAYTLLRGNYIPSLILILIYQFVLLLDYVDGPLAKKQKKYKLNWVYLDHMTHLVLSTFFLLAVSFAYFNFTLNLTFLVLGCLAAVLFLFNNSLDKKAFLAIRFNKTKKQTNSKNQNSFLKSLIKIEEPFSLFFFLIVLDLRGLLILIYTLAFLISSVQKFSSNFKELKNEKP